MKDCNEIKKILKSLTKNLNTLRILLLFLFLKFRDIAL